MRDNRMSADRRSSATIQLSRNGVIHEATIAWRRDDRLWLVVITSSAFEPVEARAFDAFDAFEALVRVRDELEPQGWRVGVAGALANVWPSGMAGDQGAGLRAYRMSVDRVEGLVDTFEPVDPMTVTTVAQQRAEIERLHGELARRAREH